MESPWFLGPCQPCTWISSSLMSSKFLYTAKVTWRVDGKPEACGSLWKPMEASMEAYGMVNWSCWLGLKTVLWLPKSRATRLALDWSQHLPKLFAPNFQRLLWNDASPSRILLWILWDIFKSLHLSSIFISSFIFIFEPEALHSSPSLRACRWQACSRTQKGTHSPSGPSSQQNCDEGSRVNRTP